MITCLLQEKREFGTRQRDQCNEWEMNSYTGALWSTGNTWLVKSSTLAPVECCPYFVPRCTAGSGFDVGRYSSVPKYFIFTLVCYGRNIPYKFALVVGRILIWKWRSIDTLLLINRQRSEDSCLQLKTLAWVCLGCL